MISHDIGSMEEYFVSLGQEMDLGAIFAGEVNVPQCWSSTNNRLLSALLSRPFHGIVDDTGLSLFLKEQTTYLALLPQAAPI